MSIRQQGGAQEPEAPEAPLREEPGQMPEEPGTAPEATMPQDPDRDPSQPPPDESGSLAKRDRQSRSLLARRSSLDLRRAPGRGGLEVDVPGRMTQCSPCAGSTST
jgi:hypothetical protein